MCQRACASHGCIIVRECVRMSFGLWVALAMVSDTESDCVRLVLAGAQWIHAGTDDASRRTEQNGSKMMRNMKHVPCLTLTHLA